MKKKIFKIFKINYKFKQFEQSIIKFNKMVNSAKKKYDTIFAYGSPTKASLLLMISHLNIGIIKGTFEDNPLKCNKYIPGTNIKIMNTNTIKEKKPKIIIILAWNFAKEIILKLKEKDLKGIRVITPLPRPKINIL